MRSSCDETIDIRILKGTFLPQMKGILDRLCIQMVFWFPHFFLTNIKKWGNTREDDTFIIVEERGRKKTDKKWWKVVNRRLSDIFFFLVPLVFFYRLRLFLKLILFKYAGNQFYLSFWQSVLKIFMWKWKKKKKKIIKKMSKINVVTFDFYCTHCLHVYDITLVQLPMG